MRIVINTLERIQGVNAYGIFSLLVFFIFFMVMAYLVFNLDKGYIEDMKNMPLEDNENDSSDIFTENNF